MLLRSCAVLKQLGLVALQQCRIGLELHPTIYVLIDSVQFISSVHLWKCVVMLLDELMHQDPFT